MIVLIIVSIILVFLTARCPPCTWGPLPPPLTPVCLLLELVQILWMLVSCKLFCAFNYDEESMDSIRTDKWICWHGSAHIYATGSFFFPLFVLLWMLVVLLYLCSRPVQYIDNATGTNLKEPCLWMLTFTDVNIILFCSCAHFMFWCHNHICVPALHWIFILGYWF